jgi:ribonuclease P protein component
MFPRSQRLDKKKFNTVYNFGTNFPASVGYFKILQWKDSDQPTKIACVVARKQSKKAIDRNRVRRRGYAAFRRCLETLPELGYGVIWFLPPEALTIDFTVLKKSVEKMILSLDTV